MELLREGRWRLLSFCFLGWVCDFYSLIVFSFLAPSISKDLALADSDLAWIHGASLFATMLGGAFFGRLADRYGRRPAFALSVGLYALGSGLCAISSGFASLLFFRFLTGVGVGGEWGIGQTLAAESVPLAMRGRASGLLQAGGPLAMILAACVGALLEPSIGWRSCFLISAAPLLLAIASMRVLPETFPRKDIVAPLAKLIEPPLRRATIAMALLLTLNMAAFWCTYSFLPKYLISDLGHSPDFVWRFQLAVSGAHLLGNLSFGWLSDRFSRQKLFAAYSLFFAAGIFAIALDLESLTKSPALFVAAISAAGLGAGNWSCFGALFADHFPPEIRASAASGLYSGSRGVQLLTQQAVVGLALFAAIPSGRAGLFLGAVFSGLAALAVSGLPRKSDSSSAAGSPK